MTRRRVGTAPDYVLALAVERVRDGGTLNQTARDFAISKARLSGACKRAGVIVRAAVRHHATTRAAVVRDVRRGVRLIDAAARHNVPFSTVQRWAA